MRAMRPIWRRMLPWAALGALALLAFHAAPHAHDEAEGLGDHCVLCPAQDTPFIVSGLPANPDPAVRPAVLPVAVSPTHAMPPLGGGSRAPPA